MSEELRNALPKIVTETLPGPKAKVIIDRRHSAVPDAIGCPYPVVIKRGEGAMIEDVDGNYFLDFVGGVGVLNIGYSRPELVEAVKAQADNYFHGMFNIVTHEGYVELAEKMNEIVPVKGDKKRTFFANSGAEADENAVKIAKAFTHRDNIIVFSGAFHGRTYLTMTMTSKKAYAKGQGQLAPGVYRAEYPNLYRAPEGLEGDALIEYYTDSIYKVFEESAAADQIAAIVAEPLQGEGGFIPAPIEWVKAVRKICDENGIMLICDEVQSGWCRTGRFFCAERWAEAGAAPDILATAKSIAGGLPLSAITAREEIMEAVPGGTIGGTYCGNPLACASALKVIDIMQKEDYAGKAEHVGKLVMERYEDFKSKYECVGDVRGLGAMLGIEFVTDKKSKTPAPEVQKAVIEYCAQHGLIVEGCGTYNNCIRFLAPLCITDEQLKAGLDIMEEGIKSCM